MSVQQIMSPEANSVAAQFEANGYAVVKQFISRLMCDYLNENIKLIEGTAAFGYGDTQVEKAFSSGSPIVTETLLEVVTPILAQQINCELYPTYSYLRIYLNGAVLEKHTDRNSCEVSATIPLSYEAPAIWPLFLESGEREIRVELEPGDALIYKGIELAHWREPFEGERQVQVFLHYVKQDGEFSDFRFDKRPGLSHHEAQANHTLPEAVDSASAIPSDNN